VVAAVGAAVAAADDRDRDQSGLEQAMTKKPLKGCLGVSRRLGLAALFLALALPAMAADQKQTMFATPEEAAKAIIDAAAKDDTATLMAILGSEGDNVISSGDEVADKAALDRFAAAAKQATRLEKVGDDKVIINVGSDDWPMPIPIVKGTDGWYFDTAAGEDEIINRRIGRNELGAIDVCRAYVQAQREYAGKDRDGSGVLKFAQKVTSSPNKKDGLYWPASSDGDVSPFGPLVADAMKEGYQKKGDQPIPYHGYYFKVLRAQGSHAPGGDYDYVINGNMIGGFALVAWPAEWAVSGVMTFIVNQQGIVYQKDLGDQTDAIVAKMAKYDPDSTWAKVE
jgi:hypothetical protein